MLQYKEYTSVFGPSDANHDLLKPLVIDVEVQA